MVTQSKRNRRYGWKADLPDHRDCLLTPPSESIALPSSVDLRAGMPAVYDQGDLGSCTANAIAGAFEYSLKKQQKLEFTPSRLFIYYNERAAEGTVSSDSGATIRDGIKVVNAKGVCHEDLWPYVVSQFKKKPSAGCYNAAKKDVALTYQRVPQTLAGIKGVLAGGLPFVFGFSVYESFESDEVAKSGIVPMPTKHEQCLGGHAVCAGGYDDAKQAILVRNSWGSGWALDGYCWMPYSYVVSSGLANDLWVIQTVS